MFETLAILFVTLWIGSGVALFNKPKRDRTPLQRRSTPGQS